jgi:CP family cyanate transporter-like MFS transporter
VLLVVGVLLLAANLRSPLTSLAPLIGQVRADFGLSNGVAGLLMALPLLAFAALSPVAPRLARRFGVEWVMLASMIVLATGILLRSAGMVGALFAGTADLGAAIAVGNVLVPSLVKREFPQRIGFMTGVYSTALSVCAALAAGVSVPISVGADLGWRAALALWFLPALIAAAAWFPLALGGGRAGAQSEASRETGGLWRSPLAWQVTLFMGLQSLAYYVTLTWLPEILQETTGMAAGLAGWMLALSQAVSIVSMFLAPVLAGRRPSQKRVVAAVVSLTLAGALGLLVAGEVATTLWVVLLGLGQGASFSLALTLFALRAPDPEHAAGLSGMAQSVGYLLAAAGPFLFGVLRDGTGSWTVPLTLLCAVLVCLLATGLRAARDAHVAAAPTKSAPTETVER